MTGLNVTLENTLKFALTRARKLYENCRNEMRISAPRVGATDQRQSIRLIDIGVMLRALGTARRPAAV